MDEKKEVPRYRLKVAHFFEPERIPADTIVDFEGLPTPGMEPLNAAAERALDEYFKANPHATLTPARNLPRTMATVVAPEPPAVKIQTVGGAK